jgi:hypothetical protein
MGTAMLTIMAAFAQLVCARIFPDNRKCTLCRRPSIKPCTGVEAWISQWIAVSLRSGRTGRRPRHSPEHLTAVAAELNRRPREILSWQSPAEHLAMLSSPPTEP